MLSSQDRRPVVLATIMISDQMATLTDQEGEFFFQLSTSNREVTLVFQESTHRQVEVVLDVKHFSVRELVVVMEYIDTIERIGRLQDGFSIHLSDEEVARDHGVNVSLSVPRNSLIIRQTSYDYPGSGHVLHSLYPSGVKPDFSSVGLRQMIYRDSNGADFTIQSFVIGSLEIVDDTGHPLALKLGHSAMLSISLKFDSVVAQEQVSNIHLFTFVDSESRWLDFGKVSVESVRSSVDQLATWAVLKGKLRVLGSLWAIGLPVRVSCHVKTRVFQSDNDIELVGEAVGVEQSDERFKRPTYYHYSATTRMGVGACLKTVCSLGGLLSINDHYDGNDYTLIEAIPPNIAMGVVMGNKDQIMFYLSDKSQVAIGGETPYYPSEEACIQSMELGTSSFNFTRNSSSVSSVVPSLLPQQSVESLDGSGEYCFVKVAIYDCAPYSDVKTLSYQVDNHDMLLAMHTDVSLPGPIDQSHPSSPGHSCQVDGIAQLRASCIEYTCGSEVHVSVTSRESTTLNSEPKTCRYWSANSNVPRSLHPSSNMNVFHFVDGGERNADLSGLYHHSSSRDLALMRCKSGNSEEPSNRLDPYEGSAVTFTCQF